MRHTVGWPGRCRWRWALLGGLALLLGFALAACAAAGATPGASSAGPTATSGSASAASASAATRASEGGAVTLKATWLGTGPGLAFTVVMDTHSVDLDDVDLSQSAVLRLDQGPEVKPSGWDAPKGGHHREGKLTFPDKRSDGGPLVGPNTRLVELVIRDVGVPERTLRWELQK